MFEFFEEIALQSGLPTDVFNNSFKVINIGNKTIFIEHFKDIVSFSTEELIVKLSHGIIKIVGENIKIKNMNLDTILVVGNITNIEIS